MAVDAQTVEWVPPSPEVAAAEAGAMARRLLRTLPDGSVIEFEEAPKGWLTKEGERRQKSWRAYYFTPAGGKRYRLPSTTTLLDDVCPKPGIAPWSEARGIEGVWTAIRNGAIDIDRMTVEETIDAVRKLKLGADAAKLRDAERGLNVHAINERYMLTGEAPKLSDHPEHHRGYIKAWIKCMLTMKLEPVEVEQLVVHPEDGYAGRLDLRARIGGLLATIDFKTQRRAGIYPSAHWQVGLYERASVRCGAEPASRKIIVVLAEDGEWREMSADHEDWRLDAALAFYRAGKAVNSACEAANRAEREARA